MKLFITQFIKHLWANEDGWLGLGANPISGQVQGAANQAGQVAGTAGANAAQEGGQLNPFFSQEMKATHGYTPGQTNELLTAAEAGAGGATGATGGMLQANAARTGNATGVGKSLDEMARDRSKAEAGASEGIAAQDVEGAKKLNQQGAAGMQGLYGTNVGAQLGAMRQQGSDLNSLAGMQGPGVFGDIEKMVGTAGQAASGAGGLMTGINNMQNG